MPNEGEYWYVPMNDHREGIFVGDKWDDRFEKGDMGIGPMHPDNVMDTWVDGSESTEWSLGIVLDGTPDQHRKTRRSVK